MRFRCHTGHAFSLKALLAEVNESIDTGLRDTMRAIEERIMLLRHMAEIASRTGDQAAAVACEAGQSFVLDPAFFGHGPEDH